MARIKVFFSVNNYNSDGDLTEECVTLDLSNGVSIRFQNAEEMKNFAQDILKMLPEIREYYPDAFHYKENI